MNARISSCGNMRAISSRLGGWNGAASGWADVSGAAPCLSRHAGQSPPSAPVGSVAPHCGHLFSILGSDSGSFILLPQKQNPNNVTRFRRKLWRNLGLHNHENVSAKERVLHVSARRAFIEMKKIAKKL